MTKLLLDGDILCYRCAAANENGTPQDVATAIDGIIERLKQELGSDLIHCYLTGSNNFRYQLYPEYKANRKDVPKPKYLKDAREYLLESYPVTVAENEEADDFMAIAQCAQTAQEQTIIVSLDKDMLQVPGWHYSWEIEGGTPDKRWKKEAKLQEISPFQGAYNFYYQMLVGDNSDNIKGVNGIGKKKATDLLSLCTTEDELFYVVRDTYGCDEEMLMNGEVLWLMRQYERTYASTDYGMLLWRNE
jgi:DNA polymerase-1